MYHTNNELLSELNKTYRDLSILQTLIFAKEFRGLHGYRPGACVPALELTRRFCRFDRMHIPNIGERVPYVIVYGKYQIQKRKKL